MPRIFISELKVDELSKDAQKIIKQYTNQIKNDPVDNIDLNNSNEIINFLTNPLWTLPSLFHYNELLKETEYGSWVIYNRYYLNHYTISVHELKEKYNTLEDFNKFLNSIGVKLNDSGGVIARTLPNDSYIEAINILLNKQKQWAYSNKPIDELMSISRLFGISSKDFEKVMENVPLMQEIINKMEKESKQFNIESTPTFIINNEHKITGAVSFKDFEEKLLTFVKSQNS